MSGAVKPVLTGGSALAEVLADVAAHRVGLDSVDYLADEGT